jgi:hypothetical protein
MGTGGGAGDITISGGIIYADGLGAAADIGNGDGGSGGDMELDESGDISEDTGDGTGMEHTDVDALRLFTVRGLVAFFSVGGWMGLAASNWEMPAALLILLSIAAGGAALYFVAWSLEAASRLQSNGNIIIDNAIGKKAEVYMSIPASNSGIGKINVIVQERLCEFEAVTNAHRSIKPGESVVVTALARSGVLLVVPEEANAAARKPKVL